MLIVLMIACYVLARNFFGIDLQDIPWERLIIIATIHRSATNISVKIRTKPSHAMLFVTVLPWLFGYESRRAIVSGTCALFCTANCVACRSAVCISAEGVCGIFNVQILVGALQRKTSGFLHAAFVLILPIACGVLAIALSSIPFQTCSSGTRVEVTSRNGIATIV
jgi:hypothetical protein